MILSLMNQFNKMYTIITLHPTSSGLDALSQNRKKTKIGLPRNNGNAQIYKKTHGWNKAK